LSTSWLPAGALPIIPREIPVLVVDQHDPHRGALLPCIGAQTETHPLRAAEVPECYLYRDQASELGFQRDREVGDFEILRIVQWVSSRRVIHNQPDIVQKEEIPRTRMFERAERL